MFEDHLEVTVTLGPEAAKVFLNNGPAEVLFSGHVENAFPLPPASAARLFEIKSGDAVLLPTKATVRSDGLEYNFGLFYPRPDRLARRRHEQLGHQHHGAGGYHSLAARPDGTVAAWGANDSGQISVPANATNVVALDGGDTHSLALRGDGTVVAWGDDSWGQTDVPADATNIIAIAAGGFHSLALKDDGNLVGWGDNSLGQLNLPGDATNLVAVAAGYAHSLALRGDGTVVAWGDNLYGQSSVDATVNSVIATAAGNYHNLILQGQFPAVPQFLSASRTGSTFTVLTPTLRGKPCLLLYKNFLADPDWNFLNSVPGDGAQKTLTDPAANDSQRLYRIRFP